MLDDTIAAIATPLGQGGLAVIRVSGENASTFIACSPTTVEMSGPSSSFGFVGASLRLWKMSRNSCLVIGP